MKNEELELITQAILRAAEKVFGRATTLEEKQRFLAFLRGEEEEPIVFNQLRCGKVALAAQLRGAELFVRLLLSTGAAAREGCRKVGEKWAARTQEELAGLGKPAPVKLFVVGEGNQPELIHKVP